MDIGRDQVARLMRLHGLRGASRAKKRFTTKSDPEAVRAPDLVKRDFTADAPNQKWVTDFTYCSTWSGIVYVAFVIDVFSRRIVGWKAARSMTTALVLDALNMAAWTRRHVSLDGLVCHSDAGSQYTSIAYTERVDDIGAAPSIGTVGDSYDNAMAESVIGLFKTELHRNPAALRRNGGPWKGLDDLDVATCAWVSWFNEERLHTELGDRTPEEVEAEYGDGSQANAA
jgi:putative transposase